MYSCETQARKIRQNESKRADAFAELVQCLDDRSLSLVIRDARGRRAKSARNPERTLSRKREAKNNHAVYRTDLA